MTTPLFDPPRLHIPRDRWKRPLIVPPDGGKPKAYTRCTRYVDCLEDKYHLELWKLRMCALGLADRPDLLLSVSAHRDDKQALNGITEQAREAAESSAASNTGTAVHLLCERVDRGRPLGTVPDTARRDVAAYQRATAMFTNVYIEQFTVYDLLRIGGTPDRVVHWNGNYYIADIKTGADVEWGALKIAMQLSVYAHGVPYLPPGERHPYEFPVDQERAIVIHLPAGTGTCELHFVNIDLGWEAVQVAAQVRRFRSHRNWYEPISIPDPRPPADAALSPFETEIAAATTVHELYALWRPEWTEQQIAAARARKAEIERAAS